MLVVLRPHRRSIKLTDNIKCYKGLFLLKFYLLFLQLISL